METVGQKLRQVREANGLSIKDIERETSIRALYIKAIEDGDYAVVPGEVYLKGFIRSYASHLGLDPQEMIALYLGGKGPAEVLPEETVLPKEFEEPVKEQKKAEKPVYEPQPEVRNEGGSGSFGKWLLAGAFVIVLALGGFFFLRSGSDKTDAVQKTQTPVAAQTKTPEKQQNPSAQPQQQPAAAKNSISITAKFSGKCWTSVSVDGKVVFEGTPNSGESMSWVGQKDVAIKAGNAAAIEIVKNGQPVGKLGNAGEVVEKIFSVNSTN